MNQAAAKLFSRLTLSDKTVNIKLLGDSITHGVGGTGFAQNGDPIAAGFRRNPDGFCWAKLFSGYLGSRFDCKVTNNACTGTTIEFVLRYFDELVSDDDDIVLCAIGTNNRHQYLSDAPLHTKREHMETFYANVLALDDKFKNAKKDVVFIANIPASVSDEQNGADYVRLFHMNDLRDMYVKASFERNFPLIDMYDAFLEYAESCGIPYTSLLLDGLHPNDEGHRAMFSIIIRELGLASAY